MVQTSSSVLSGSPSWQIWAEWITCIVVAVIMFCTSFCYTLVLAGQLTSDMWSNQLEKESHRHMWREQANPYATQSRGCANIVRVMCCGTIEPSAVDFRESVAPNDRLRYIPRTLPVVIDGKVVQQPNTLPRQIEAEPARYQLHDQDAEVTTAASEPSEELLT